MAANYEVLESYKTIQVLSGQTIQDVQYVTAKTIPTGIVFSYAVDYGIWRFDHGPQIIANIADELEFLVTNNHVVAGAPVQDLDANGLLVDYCDVIVRLDRSAQGLPPLDGTVSLSMTLIVWETQPEGGGNPPGGTTAEGLCSQEYARLEALNAG